MTATPPLLTSYTLNPAHRGGAGNMYKSRWTISPTEEEAVFHQGYNMSWIDQDSHTWGLYIVDGSAQNLGTPSLNAKHSNALFIGKFLDDDGHGIWHGYPADHRSNGNRDIPPAHIRNQWLQHGFLKKSVITLLSRGKSGVL